MTRDIEDRLVAMLDAVSAPLPRREIFNRADDDFETEEELAKALGRLCADGRLVKSMRPRFNKQDEAVYTTPRVARAAQIGAAAKNVAEKEIAANDGRQDLREVLELSQPPEPEAPPPNEKENVMARKSKGEIHEAVRAAVLGAREPLSAADVAKAAGVGVAAAKRALKALAKEKIAQCTGAGRATRWGPFDTTSAGKAQARGKGQAASPQAPAGVTRRFGYFSDNALQVDCENCKGVLSEEDLVSLRAFTARFEQ